MPPFKGPLSHDTHGLHQARFSWMDGSILDIYRGDVQTGNKKALIAHSNRQADGR